MKRLFLTLLFLVDTLFAQSYRVLTVSDTINPGTADYIVRGIEEAEAVPAEFIIIEIDTPGGLLTSTRTIVQKMLSSKIPVIVFVAPKGAQAGSAGALLTFASDIAAMAPGTNIGAAHPISGGGEKMDKVMEEKVANDTAAFAESLAKAKGRNTDWARKAVTKSASITANEALKEGVIELIAEDRADLLKKLIGFKLKVPKGKAVSLPATIDLKEEAVPMNIKQRIVSFFANPNIAYLIMSLGGLCIWVEISHPGLIFPGVLGGICILLSLVSFQMLPIHYGALGLVLGGMALLVAELYVPSFGALEIGGILSFIVGSLYLMDTTSPSFQLSLTLILPTAAVLTSFILVLGWLVSRSRHSKVRSGIEGMIGEFGEVRETVNERSGKVFVQGELWNAITDAGQSIPQGSIVIVEKQEHLVLKVKLNEEILKGR